MTDYKEDHSLIINNEYIDSINKINTLNLTDNLTKNDDCNDKNTENKDNLQKNINN